MFKSDSTIATSPVSQFRKRSNRARGRLIGRAPLEPFFNAHCAKEGPAEQTVTADPWFFRNRGVSHSRASHEDRNSVPQDPHRASQHGRIPSEKSGRWKLGVRQF